MLIGFFLGVSLSSFYWWWKFENLTEESQKIFDEITKQKAKGKKND